ncbi:MAG: GAF domain-containing sensor histidine kinase [Myxococcota bacterium]
MGGTSDDRPEVGKSEAVIRTLYAITSEHEQGFDHQLRRLLRLGCERFDLDIGVLSNIRGERYTIVHVVAPPSLSLSDGDEFELGVTPCSLTLRAEGPITFENMGQTHETHPAYTSFRLESYIGVPITVDGECFGTLNFSSPEPRARHFDEVDVDALQLMGQWVGTELARRRRLDDLRAANTELEAFGRAVSHDLRSPLTAAIGYVDIFRKEHEASLDDEAKEDLTQLRASVMRMNTLVEGMMGLFRLSSAEPARESVDLSAIAMEIAERLKVQNPARRVEWSIADGLHAVGDRALLHSLLDNLLRNAWKFSASETPARIEVGRNEGEGAACFYVRDNGVGLPPGKAERIFEPFVRLDDDAPGDGLGLATARRIVRAHGGKIWARSAPEGGTTFSFTLDWSRP